MSLSNKVKSSQDRIDRIGGILMTGEDLFEWGKVEK